MKGGPRFLAVLYIMRTIPKATPQQLEKMRSLPNYRFRLFDESFPQYHDGDAKMFLTYGRQMLYSSLELSEDRLLLAKLQAARRLPCMWTATTTRFPSGTRMATIIWMDGNGRSSLTAIP